MSQSHLFHDILTLFVTRVEAGQPDPFRIQHRETLNQVIQKVVRERIGRATAILELGLPVKVSQELSDMARADLARWGIF